jgi:Helix-hairpin-helix domain
MARKQSRTLNTVPPINADDFRLIKGIGPVLAGRLYNAGVCTFNQLASLSPAKLAEMVTGLSVKQISKQDWSDQAFKLATKKTQTKPPQKDNPKQSISQHYENFTIEFLLDEKKIIHRTRVVHVQSGDEDTWAGWEQTRLEKFFVQSAGLNIPLLGTFASPLRTPKTSPREDLPNSKPNDFFGGVLRASKLETMPLDSNMPQQIAHANETFNVSILLDLTGVKTSPSITLNCTITVWAKKFGKGEHQIIGEQHRTFLPVEKIPCVVKSTIPSQGIYRLEALVTLTPEAIAPSPHSTIRAWLESDPLQVY